MVDFFGFPLAGVVSAFSGNVVGSVKYIDAVGIAWLMAFSDIFVEIIEESVIF